MLMLALGTLVAAIVLMGGETTTTFFGEKAQASLVQMGVGERLLVTNDYSAMLTFAGEPSVEPIRPGVDAAFRLAAVGTSVNSDCWIARFEFRAEGARASVSRFSVQLGQPGYGTLLRGERALTPQEDTMLREAMSKLDNAALPSYPGTWRIDMWPMLLESGSMTNHVMGLRDGDYESGDMFEELYLFTLRIVRTTLLQPVAPGNAG